jgi:uncharacterized repeat protein (TIGR03803 family)
MINKQCNSRGGKNLTTLNRTIRVWGALLVCWLSAAKLTPAQSGASIPPAETYTVLDSFDYTNGSNPYAGLVQGTDGNLYGTTFGGGHGKYGEGEGYGTVFKITPGSKEKTLYLFCSQGGNECTDGLFPQAGLVQGRNGKFYGTTSGGGSGYGNDHGTVFSITSRGTLTTLYSFCSKDQQCTDGTNPLGGLAQGEDGSFYGTTEDGGTNDGGTVFKVTADGTLTTLYNFCSQYNNGYCLDGLYPKAGLALGTDGKFYGTTFEGGTYNAGTVFSIAAGGAGTFTTIYSFCSQKDCTDGDEPEAGLIEGADGSFYGTDENTVFKITPEGKLTTLYRFCPKGGDPCPDGNDPVAGLVQGTDGNFYGTTEHGGNNSGYCGSGCGTIFQITPKGRLTTLYDFCSQGGDKCMEGELPLAGLVQDTNGTFYGTAAAGGAEYLGVVFSLSTGLGPFVVTEPTYGKVGTAVKVLGTNLTGAASVTFNGAAATFTVVSASEITTTVPTGATTGPVRVITPVGKLQSNVPFRVM